MAGAVNLFINPEVNMTAEFLRAFESATITDRKLRVAMAHLGEVAFIATQAKSSEEREALENALLASANALGTLFNSAAAPSEVVWR